MGIIRKPWLEPNAHGESPGDICCQRAVGKHCHEHDPQNYLTWYFTKPGVWLVLIGLVFGSVFAAYPILRHQWEIIYQFWFG